MPKTGSTPVLGTASQGEREERERGIPRWRFLEAGTDIRIIPAILDQASIQTITIYPCVYKIHLKSI